MPGSLSPQSLEVYPVGSPTEGGTVGFFAKLFGFEEDDSAKRTVEAGQPCAKCGQPVPRGNMGFDSGGGRPIHVKCPEAPEVGSSD
jgi:hypothetical protein